MGQVSADTGGPVAAGETPGAAPDLREYRTEDVYCALRGMAAWDERIDNCGFPGDQESARRHAARVIAGINRREGWEVATAWGDDGTDDLADWARPLRTRAPNVRLDRPHLELAIVAHYLMQRRFSLVRGGMPDRQRQVAAVAAAWSLLAQDPRAALGRVAAGLFQGTPEQRLRQLSWLLDGRGPDLVVCRHCFYPIEEGDPFVTTDKEDEQEAGRRACEDLPRYSAHIGCATDATGQGQSGRVARTNGGDWSPDDWW